MTNDELRAIRERCEAATPGPWEMCDVCVSWQGGWLAHGQLAGTRKAAQADAAFIASARTDVPALLAEVERLREELETRADIASSTIARLKQQVREERAEVERLKRELQVERCGVRPIDDLLQRVTTDRDELHVAWKREREEVERLTRERDEARDVILGQIDVLANRDASIVHLQARLEVERLMRSEGVHPSSLTDVTTALEDERDELLVRVANADAELRATREAYNEAVRQRDDAFLKCKAWMQADAEQARSYGLTYEGIRKMVHDYLDDELSFGKLVKLIRGAAKAMAEDQLSGKPGGFEP